MAAAGPVAPADRGPARAGGRHAAAGRAARAPRKPGAEDVSAGGARRVRAKGYHGRELPGRAELRD